MEFINEMSVGNETVLINKVYIQNVTALTLSDNKFLLLYNKKSDSKHNWYAVVCSINGDSITKRK